MIPSRCRVLLAAVLALAWTGSAPQALRGQVGGTVADADASSARLSPPETNCWDGASRSALGGRARPVATDRRGGRAYVARWGNGAASGPMRGRRGGGTTRGAGRPGEENGAVTVVDLRERRTVDRFDLGPTGPISDVWAGHEGGRIWVALERAGRVLTLDARTGDLLMEWTIGRTSAQSGAVSRNDRYLFVTNREAGSLTVIDRVTVAANTVDLDRGAGPVAVGPAGRAWVADVDDGRLWVVDGPSGRVLAELPSGGRRPVDLERRPGNHEMWVLHGGSGGLQVYDTGRPERSGGISLTGRPSSIRFSADGSQAFVSVPDRGVVLTVDAEQRRVEGASRAAPGPESSARASCPTRRCAAREGRWYKGEAGLPGAHWTEADLIGDLWCGG